MGWIQKRPRKPDERGRVRFSYRAGFRTADGRIVTRTFDRAHDARAWLLEAERAARTGVLADPRRAREPLGSFFEYVMQTTSSLRPKTREVYRGLMERHVLPSLGARPLEQIAPADVKRLLAGLADRPATAHAVYRVLRRVLQVAVDEGRLVRNPAARLQLRRPEPRAVRVLEPAELLALADAVEPRWRSAVLLMGLAGLRVGELAGLQVRDYDPLHGTLRIERAATEVEGRVTFGPTKGGRPRALVLPRLAREALEEHLRGLPDAGPDTLIFTGPRGGLIRPTLFGRRVIAPAARRAGIEPPPTPHQLRHAAVSLALAAGWNARAVQELAGHADVGTTINVYSHLIGSLHAEQVARLDALLEDAARRGRTVVAMDRSKRSGTM
jgi:integrase